MTPSGLDSDQPLPELVARARAGEEAALASLLRRVHPRVHRWASLRSRNAADADDLTQDVLVRVVRTLASFRGDASFTSWLYRVVANAARDRDRRSRRRASREEDLAAAEALPATGREPGEAADRRRLLERVGAAFLELPERQREVFDMADLQGLSSPEIAEILGITPSTVRVALLHARRAIRSRVLASDPELVEEMLP